jgi:hypothetical protein
MGSLRGCCSLVAVATNESSLLRIDGASNALGRFVDLAHDFLQRKAPLSNARPLMAEKHAKGIVLCLGKTIYNL